MQLVEHDSLFGAMEYGFEASLPVLRRLWWLGIIYALLMPLQAVLPAVWALLSGAVLGTAMFMPVGITACANVTKEHIVLTRDAWLCALINFVLGFWWVPGLLPVLLPARGPWILLAIVFIEGISFWITSKIAGAFAFFFLSDPRARNLKTAYSDCWHFISGATWWKLFAITAATVVPVIVVYMIAGLLNIQISLTPTLDPPHYIRDVIVNLALFLAIVWVTCAMVAIISTSPALVTRNLEASLQQTQ